MKDKEINELVKKLDQELAKHDLTFNEYLLYRALHLYENRNKDVIRSLEEKGLIKDNKIVDHNKMDDIDMTMSEFFTPVDEANSNIKDEDYMHILSLLYMTSPVSRPR